MTPSPIASVLFLSFPGERRPTEARARSTAVTRSMVGSFTAVVWSRDSVVQCSVKASFARVRRGGVTLFLYSGGTLDSNTSAGGQPNFAWRRLCSRVQIRLFFVWSQKGLTYMASSLSKAGSAMRQSTLIFRPISIFDEKLALNRRHFLCTAVTGSARW